jgi:hypothetical protein
MIRLLKAIAVVFAALIILFEEWLWEPLKQLMLAASRLPVVRRVVAYISHLPPFAALVLYLAPSIVLLPVKLTGLWLTIQGHLLSGITLFLGAKVLATALLAWLFSLTRPALMQIVWFARAHAWVTELSATAHEWLYRQRPYRTIRKLLEKMRKRGKNG